MDYHILSLAFHIIHWVPPEVILEQNQVADPGSPGCCNVWTQNQTKTNKKPPQNKTETKLHSAIKYRKPKAKNISGKRVEWKKSSTHLCSSYLTGQWPLGAVCFTFLNSRDHAARAKFPGKELPVLSSAWDMDCSPAQLVSFPSAPTCWTCKWDFSKSTRKKFPSMNRLEGFGGQFLGRRFLKT